MVFCLCFRNPTDKKYLAKDFRNATWLEYNLKNHSYMEISNNSHNRINYRQKEYAFWRQYFKAVANRFSGKYTLFISRIHRYTHHFHNM